MGSYFSALVLLCLTPGSEDIHNGNLKLILGLVWTLIRHYQIGSSGKGLALKKAMLLRVSAAISEYNIENLTTDWNDGRALCALVDSIQPGLCPNHQELDATKGLENCRLGMRLAEDHLDIPQILDPEDLSSKQVDDLSVMTYLSYFISMLNDQLLEWLQAQLPEQHITNLTTDWNDGINLAALLDHRFCLCPNWRDMDPEDKVGNMERLLPVVASSTSVDCLLSAKGMADPSIDEITMAAYLGKLRTAKVHFTRNNFTLVALPKSVSVSKPVQVEVSVTGPASDELSQDIQVCGRMSDGTEVVGSFVKFDGHSLLYQLLPTHLGKMQISATYEDENINNSPTMTDVELLFSLEGIVELLNSTPRVGCSVMFKIKAKETPPPNSAINITAKGPSQHLKTDVTCVSDNVFLCTLTPDEEGPYEVTVEANGLIVEGCPFTFVVHHLFEASLLDAEKFFVGIPVKFSAKALGMIPEGETPIIVGRSEEEGEYLGETHKVQQGTEGDCYELSIVPRMPGMFFVAVMFKGLQVANSPFALEVDDLLRLDDLDAEELCTVGNPFKFTVTPLGAIPAGESLSVSLKGNTKEAVGVAEISNEGCFECVVTPIETGSSELLVKFLDMHVSGSPCTLVVKDMFETKKVPANASFTLGSPVMFAATAKGCVPEGEEPVVVAVDEHGKEHTGVVERTDEKKFTCSVVPPAPGKWRVEARYKESTIKGTPFTVTVGHLFKVHQLPSTKASYAVGAAIDFQLSALGPVPEGTAVEVIGMGPKREVVGIVSKQDDNTFGCSLAPAEIGNFEVSVVFMGSHIKGSPFTIPVTDLFVVGQMPEKKVMKAKEPFSFVVNALAPPGDMRFSVSAQGPTSAVPGDILHRDDGSYLVEVTPMEQGTHRIDSKMEDSHIKGSPFTVEVIDPSKCAIVGKPPSSIHIGDEAKFVVTTAGSGSGSLETFCEAEGETKLSLVMNKTAETEYTITIKPTVVASAKVYVQFGGESISGTPFMVNVVDAEKCSVIDLPDGCKIGERVCFALNSRGAGCGLPHVEFVGPNGTLAPTIVDNKDGTYWVELERVTDMGYYRIDIKYGGRLIPGAPFNFQVEEAPGVEQCHITGPGLTKLVAGKPAKFKIMTIEKGLLEKGQINVKVVATSGNRKGRVRIVDNKDNSYTVAYMVDMIGYYYIHVKFYGQAVAGSPFKVVALEGPNATLVKAYGPALNPNSIIMSATPLEFFVNASKAGDGDLVVVVRGHKEDPKVFIADDGDGVYSVKFEILGHGKYYANVWWGANHVPGSPFPLKVVPKPNPAMVKVYGPGIQENVIINEPAEFTIETQDAGIGTLSIRIHGIKDAFKVDANPLSHENKRTLIAKYDPTWPGDYTVAIKWHGIHVPGSPFKVHVYDPDEVESEDTRSWFESGSEAEDEDSDGLVDLEGSGVQLTNDQARLFAAQLAQRHEIGPRHPVTSSTPMAQGGKSKVIANGITNSNRVSFNSEDRVNFITPIVRDPYSFRDYQKLNASKASSSKGFFGSRSSQKY